MRLTTTQLSLIVAAIALAAPAITYRANARLDRDRWVRERRAETYISALAVLGRIAAFLAEPRTRPDPSTVIPDEQWRELQAQVEAFASTRVVALRDQLLTDWDRYKAQVAAATAATDTTVADSHRQQAESHRARVRTLYADLISQVREELKQGDPPWWRRKRRAPSPAVEHPPTAAATARGSP